MFLKKYFPKFLSLSFPLSICLNAWCLGENEFYEFLIFLISGLMIFFIFSIYNAAGHQVDQILIQAKLVIMDLKIMCPHMQNEKGQLIQSCLRNPFNNNQIHFLFGNNTSKPPDLFMYSHYVPLIIFFKNC